MFPRRQAVMLMASSTGTDGTPAARGSGVGCFRSFRITCNRMLYQVVKVFTKSGVPTYYTSYTFLPRQKEYACDNFL